MAININPNRINIATGTPGKASERRRQLPSSSDRPVVPKRAPVNIIPQPESLATLIRSAVAALREGITWDRGTILNILV